VVQREARCGTASRRRRSAGFSWRAVCSHSEQWLVSLLFLCVSHSMPGGVETALLPSFLIAPLDVQMFLGPANLARSVLFCPLVGSTVPKAAVGWLAHCELRAARPASAPPVPGLHSLPWSGHKRPGFQKHLYLIHAALCASICRSQAVRE
jgi:hypothetical protein